MSQSGGYQPHLKIGNVNEINELGMAGEVHLVRREGETLRGIIRKG